MQALVKTAPGPGNVALLERPEPVPGPGQALVEVTGAGVCGTDLHIVDDEYGNAPPVTMGHEVAGRVAQVGAGVDPEWQGQPVVCETYLSTCGHCDPCRDGRPNLCPQRQSIGSMRDGAFASHVLVAAQGLHRVPDGLDPRVAALCEPLACVANCLCDPGAVDPGDRVLVTGPGAMGLLAAQVARAAGGDVLVVGTPADTVRLEVAAALGFATAATTEQSAIDGFGPDVTVECSGSAAAVATCLNAVRRGGGHVQVGLAGKPVTVPLDLVCFREVVVTSGFASTPRSWRRALQLLTTGRVVLDPLVTEVAPLADWERVFAATRAAQGLKFVFDPQI